MPDPLRTAFAALGGAFAAGAGWFSLKARITQTRRDLNGLGARVKAREEFDAKLEGRIDELRAEIVRVREELLKKDGHDRERFARLEERLGIPPTGES